MKRIALLFLLPLTACSRAERIPLTPTATPTYSHPRSPYPAAGATGQVGGIPDPRVTNPELFDLASSDALIP